MATIKERLDWAFKNQEKDPVAKEYVNRYRKGLLNPELTKEGMQPVPIQKPKIDMAKVMAIPQEEGLMSTIPSKPVIADAGEDIGEFFNGLGKQFGEAYEGSKEIAQDKDSPYLKKVWEYSVNLRGEFQV